MKFHKYEIDRLVLLVITNVFLVRHAHSVYTPDELHRPLSERGVSDAKKVTEQLKSEEME